MPFIILALFLVMLDNSQAWKQSHNLPLICSLRDWALTSWSPWVDCTFSCGKMARQWRTRHAFKLTNCFGFSPYRLDVLMQIRSCNQWCYNGGTLKDIWCNCKQGFSGFCCEKVKGGWSSWSSWRNCSKNCGKGEQNRTRSCINPPPSNGGLPCAGPSQQSQACDLHQCPVNGGRSSWSSWTSCNQSCGIGSQERSRNCTRPSPSYGGKPCQGAKREKQMCNKQPCPGWTLMPSPNPQDVSNIGDENFF